MQDVAVRLVRGARTCMLALRGVCVCVCVCVCVRPASLSPIVSLPSLGDDANYSIVNGWLGRATIVICMHATSRACAQSLVRSPSARV